MEEKMVESEDSEGSMEEEESVESGVNMEGEDHIEIEGRMNGHSMERIEMVHRWLNRNREHKIEREVMDREDRYTWERLDWEDETDI